MGVYHLRCFMPWDESIAKELEVGFLQTEAVAPTGSEELVMIGS